MKILAFDTTTTQLCLGLLEQVPQPGTLALERCAVEHNELVERKHAEVILERIQMLFAGASLDAQADLIVVGTGPGSYTGVRVGVSLALGLARAWNAKVVGVGTLEAIAAAHTGLVAPSLDARRGNVYCATYRNAGDALEVVHPVAKRTLEEFTALMPAGTCEIKDGVPSGLVLARLGLKKHLNPGSEKLEPMYL